MARTIVISVTAFFLIASAWSVNLVTYHPGGPDGYGLNPLSPVQTLQN